MDAAVLDTIDQQPIICTMYMLPCLEEVCNPIAKLNPGKTAVKIH